MFGLKKLHLEVKHLFGLATEVVCFLVGRYVPRKEGAWEVRVESRSLGGSLCKEAICLGIALALLSLWSASARATEGD